VASPSSELLLDALATFGPDAALLRNLRADGDTTLAERLLASAAGDADRRATVVDFIGHAARSLAPEGVPPADGAAASVWTALVSAADALNGSGVHALGRLPFIDDARCRLLLDEARHQFSSTEELGATRAVARAGDALAALAVSRRLRETVSQALGFAVTPTYDALYEYDPPGSRVGTHVDSREYEVVCHLLLEHTGRHSVLVAHLPSGMARIELRVGGALVLRGRGTIHSWEALGADERRILIAIGFRREATSP
jgi:hypothetical protein